MWCHSSHDADCPEEAWNLYQHIENVEALNISSDGCASAKSIFKSYKERLSALPCVTSNSDVDFILKVWFRTPVNIRRLCVAWCGQLAGQAARVQCFCGTVAEELDFDGMVGVQADQSIELPINPLAEHWVQCDVKHFTRVSFLLLRFQGVHGGCSRSHVSYIGFEGEHSHASREVVDAKHESMHAEHDVASEDETNAGSDNFDCSVHYEKPPTRD
eukprot:TRINITY_DN31787_c0_g1_i1.p1 TRINITY_DN31787_c0_g1~~TRINITY_DN31787_c0_g1_i1.p1  ORF type:complete len:216 (-),score=43.06 TRINITY_DN31787_c0_g1_i1:138-785(-)